MDMSSKSDFQRLEECNERRLDLEQSLFNVQRDRQQALEVLDTVHKLLSAMYNDPSFSNYNRSQITLLQRFIRERIADIETSDIPF